MENVGFRIAKMDAYPATELAELFRGLPVANIADCMNRIACLDAAIRPLNRTLLLGTAFTVRASAGDNLMFHKALDLARPGEVIVVAGGGSMDRAYCGEIMVRYAQARGLAGFIIDGCIRDSRELSEGDFPVYARGATPNGPYKNGPGEIGYPVAIGGQVIHPGDILVGDGDGVAVIRPHEAAEIAAAAAAVLEKEHRTMEAILDRLDRSWIDQTLRAKGAQGI